MTRLLCQEVAAAVRDDLHGLGGGGDAACVVVRLEVAFNDGHAKFGSQIRSVRSSRDVLPAPGELMRFRARMPCLAN